MVRCLNIYKVFIGILFLAIHSNSQDIDISGIIYDSDSLVVEGAEILLSNQAVTVKSDSNGVFNIYCQTTKNTNYLDKIPQSAHLKNHTLFITSTRKNQKLKIKVFNLKGRIVKEISFDNISEGLYSYNVASITSSISNGLYLLKISVGKDSFVKKYIKTNNYNASINKSPKLTKSRLNKRQLPIDTIVINRANYKIKKIPVNSYTIDLSKIYMDDDTNFVEINERTKIVGDSLFNFIDTNSTLDSVIINTGSILFDSLKVGDVIATGPMDKFPTGIFKKVTSISKMNNQIFIKTENAALTDAIDNCNISVTRTLQMDTSDSRGMINISLTKKHNDYFSTTGSATFDIDVEFNVKIEKNGTRSAKENVYHKMKFKSIFDLGFKAAVTTEDSIETQIGEYKLAPIWLLLGGFLPIVIQPEFQVHLGAKFETSREINAGIRKDFIQEVIFEKKKGLDWPQFNTIKNENSYTLPTMDNISFKASIEPYVKGTLNFMFGNTVGPYGGIKVYLNGGFEPLSNPWWTLSTGIKPIVGTKLEYLNKSAYDKSFTLDMGYNKLLTMAGPKDFSCEKIGDSIVVEWDTSFSGADTFIIYASKNPEISKTQYDQLFIATSSPHILPIGNYGSASKWYFMATAYNGIEKVHSQPSNIDSIEIELDFFADTTHAHLNDPLQFTINTNINELDNYEWNFGDGQTSNEENPIHEYSNEGIYSVSVKISGPNYPEQIIEKTDYITIKKDTVQTFYESGELKTIEEWNSSSRHGVYTEYYKSRNVKIEAYYFKGLLGGTRTTYYDNSLKPIDSLGSYSLGYKHGEFWTYYEDGVVKSYTPYSADIVDGIAYENYPSGDLKQQTPFKNGEIYGLILQFFENGDTSAIIPFELGQSVGNHGLLKMWHESTHKLKDLVPYKNGEIFGILYQFFDNGDTASISPYTLGASKGWNVVYKNWHDNHVLEQVSSYKNNEWHGNVKMYTTEGILYRDDNWYENQANGPFKYYYESNGLLKTEGQYDMGDPIGNWRSLDITNAFINEYTFNNSGELHGASTLKYNGLIIEQLNYSNGKASGNYVVKYLSGNDRVIGRVDSVKLGIWSHYREDGKIEANYEYLGRTSGFGRYININGVFKDSAAYIGNNFTETLYYESENEMSYTTYDFGVKHGPYLQYYDTDKKTVSTMGQYDNDEKSGKWYFFDDKGVVTDSTVY